MTDQRLGIAYFGNRYAQHARQDLRDIGATGGSIVNHVMSEADLRWSAGTIADLVNIGKALGLENWLSPWGLGGAFGGEAPSYAVMNSLDHESGIGLSDRGCAGSWPCFGGVLATSRTSGWFSLARDCWSPRRTLFRCHSLLVIGGRTHRRGTPSNNQ